MYYRLILLGCFSLAFNPVFPQSRKYVIAVIGSSTAQGIGANPIDSSWVNLTKYYYQDLGEIDTIYNVALGGQTTYDGMPGDYVPPTGRPAPDTATNITKALSFNPDVVLINFPSNDAAADYTITETMSNLRIMYQAVVAAGKTAYVTTSQPRTSLNTGQKELLFTMRDSVEAEFGPYSLDFYDPIVASDSLDINPIYNYDGTHVNNAGHQQLFQVVQSANILSGVDPLALSLVNFTAVPHGAGVLLHWTLANVSSPTSVVIQRSSDGTSFEIVSQQAAAPRDTDTASWTDPQPIPGTSYYRLEYGDAARWQYSSIITVNLSPPGWGIGKLTSVAGAEEIQAEILSPAIRTATVSVYSTAGELVYREQVTVSPPSLILTIPATGWADGEYFLRLVSDQGNVQTKAFMRF